MLAELPREILNLLDGVELCECIHGILHRVGRQDSRVVAELVAGVEIALELDSDGELFQLMAIRLPRDLDQADARFSVIAVRNSDGHLASSIGAVTEWTQEQRDVIVLRRIIYHE